MTEESEPVMEEEQPTGLEWQENVMAFGFKT